MLLELARRIHGFPARAKFRASLKRRNFELPAAPPIAAFGFSEAAPFVHGGRVKLLHLVRIVPHDEERFNILYLVSSALPEHAEDLAGWALARGAKLVWNQNGVAFPAWAGADPGRFNAPMRRLMRKASYVVYQSEFCRLSAERWLEPAAVPSRVLYNPVDLHAFSPAAAPPPLNCCRLLAAGTHNQPFRVLGALEALRRLRCEGREAHLTIAGALRWQGAEREVLRAIDEANLRPAVRILPAFSQTEASTLLRESHILLHLKYHDPCPTMVIEALASGIPVIGSDSGGMRELADNDCGELIPVPLNWSEPSYPSPESTVSAIRKIMDRWPDFSRSARLRAERKFGVSQWISAHREIFASVLNLGGNSDAPGRQAHLG